MLKINRINWQTWNEHNISFNSWFLQKSLYLLSIFLILEVSARIPWELEFWFLNSVFCINYLIWKSFMDVLHVKTYFVYNLSHKTFSCKIYILEYTYIRSHMELSRGSTLIKFTKYFPSVSEEKPYSTLKTSTRSIQFKKNKICTQIPFPGTIRTRF